MQQVPSIREFGFQKIEFIILNHSVKYTYLNQKYTYSIK
ncbi:hypothetical protein GGR92_001603 [Spirosoma lacussanchae]